MNNVKTELKGKLLVITIDTSAEGKLSASGKSHVIASTGGFADSGVEGVRFGLNVIRSIPKSK